MNKNSGCALNAGEGARDPRLAWPDREGGLVLLFLFTRACKRDYWLTDFSFV